MLDAHENMMTIVVIDGLLVVEDLKIFNQGL